MLGTLRLILALAVAASHAGYYPGGLNPGVAAVIGFYLISGYVMTGLQRRHYPGWSNARGFYVDRAVRLLPQYLFYAGLTLVWQLVSGRNTLFLQHAPGPGDLMNNLLIVPLNYFMYNGADRYTLIPPAWSLGAEIQFYLIAPVLLLRPARLLVSGTLSLAVLGLALAGVLHPDAFGYRLLPGVLIFFVLGATLNHLHAAQRRRLAVTLTVVALLAALGVATLLHASGTLRIPYKQETLIGLAIAFPLLAILAPRVRRAWDDRLGDISYGVFLNHFLLIWLFFPQGLRYGQLAVLLLGSVVLSAISQRFIERPLLAWRHRVRKPDPARNRMDIGFQPGSTLKNQLTTTGTTNTTSKR